MAKYTIISDVGQAITNILRDSLTPEPIDRAEKIGHIYYLQFYLFW